MRYFKNENNDVYAYEDDCDESFILPELIAIAEEEAKAILNQPQTEEQLIADAEIKKSRLRTVADAEIVWRQDAVDAGIATDEEITGLEHWRTYRVLLMRVDTSKPEFPQPPNLG